MLCKACAAAWYWFILGAGVAAAEPIVGTGGIRVVGGGGNAELAAAIAHNGHRSGLLQRLKQLF